MRAKSPTRECSNPKFISFLIGVFLKFANTKPRLYIEKLLTRIVKSSVTIAQKVKSICIVRVDSNKRFRFIYIFNNDFQQFCIYWLS